MRKLAKMTAYRTILWSLLAIKQILADY